MAESILEIENLSIEFFNYPVFKNLSLSVPAGQFLTILGPNGAGKSCLIKAILGLLPPSSGTIRIAGKAPVDVPFDWIGYVPQVKTLDRSFPGRALELVVTGLQKSWPWRIDKTQTLKAKEALGRVGASHLADRPIGTLSGGELQRVFLARCLVRNPKLILLDEPATGIDVTLIADMYQLLDTIRRDINATIVMVTHDLTAAFYHADLVLLINQEAVYFGTPQDNLTDDHLRQTFGHAGHAHVMATGGRHHA
jgi:zinc transport system ATP-binding protein